MRIIVGRSRLGLGLGAPRPAAWLSALVVTLLIGGCGSLAPDGPAPDAQQHDGLPYYVGESGVSLYPGPRAADAKRVLDRHEKVIRTRLQSGWALVTVDRTGEQGWVDNAKLIWRLPRTAAGVPADAAPAAPVEAAEQGRPAPGSGVSADSGEPTGAVGGDADPAAPAASPTDPDSRPASVLDAY